MYSNDRKIPLESTISCLEEMPLYDKCQKTLIVDGKIQDSFKDWDVVQIPRIGDKFCWGRMWDAGVCTAKNEKVFYLDSDRLLPKKFLEEAYDLTENDSFVFTSNHFQIIDDISLDDCKYFLENFSSSMMLDERFMGKLAFETRHSDPIHRPGKNVMSGSTTFTKKTYFRLGGVDHWYCGHGAYADTDFHYSAAINNCKFINLDMPELHWQHCKIEQSKSLSQQELWIKSLHNFIRYCVKWNLPLVLADELAFKSGVKTPRQYVREHVDFLRQSPRNV